MRRGIVLGIIALLCITPSMASFTPSYFALDTAPEADKAIRVANENLIDAFTAVVAAENSGAAVTVLVSDLNEALRLLNESRGLYEKGNYSLAIARADSSMKLSNGIILSAKGLEEEAVQEATFRSIITICGAILAIVALYVLGYLGWRWWNKRSYKKLMEMRVKGVEVTKGG